MTSFPGRSVTARRDAALAPRPTIHAGLVARSRELAHIEQLLWQVRRGRAGVLGLRGECGVGKSALIEAAVARATEFRTVQVRGTGPSEGAEGAGLLPDALHELAVPFDRTTQELPRFVDRDGGPAAPPPVPAATVEAATRTLRRMVAEATGPLLVTVDDCQALPPVLVLAMVAAVLGHLREAPIGLVLAWRDTPHLQPFDLGRDDVPVHRLSGLTVPQARELLASRFEQPPGDGVLAELVGRTAGNPLALVEVCGRLTPAQLAGWHPLPDPLPLAGASAEAFDVVRYLPAATRRALAVVAAGGASLDAVVAAMDRMGVGMGDLGPAIDAGVVFQRGPRLDFRHPLVRSVAFHRAPPEVRQAVRRALSDVLAETDAIEASAYHASVDVAGPDELAARRLVEAARVALDRGEPGSAARHEELAARCAASPDAVVQHLADAAGHWMAAGEVERARYCLDAGVELDASSTVTAELEYHQARLTRGAGDAKAADRMVGAAEACVAERPHRALAMLVDAAAWRVLADDPAGATRTADRAVRLAGAVSSHSEVLARTVRAAAVLAGGDDLDEMGERGQVSLLIGQTERFPSSPEVAFVIGRGLLHQGLRRQADRWSQWITRCAEHSGDVALAAVPPLLECSLRLADGDPAAAADALEASPAAPQDAGSVAMAAWSWQLATSVHAAAGRYEQGFSAAAQLFAMTDDVAAPARLRALPALALLELQRGRKGAAVAWARAVEHDLGLDGAAVPPSALTQVAPVVASVLLLARSPLEAPLWAPAPDGEGPWATVPPWCRAWIEGVCEADAARAVGRLEMAAAALRDQPLLHALVDLCCGLRLADAGLAREASDRLTSLERRMLLAGAAGVAELAARERDGLPDPSPAPYRFAAPGVEAAAPPATARPPRTDVPRVPEAPPEWEISVLGGFGVKRRGKPVPLPASLATQAIKIVTLQARLTVDELIELLWEDAEPGVGTRRLRNVLWRIRSLCGDLLVRDDSFLRLATGAVTDLDRFRALADQALVGPDAGTPAAVELARAALECYRGELLPGDRYADWAATARESATRTQLRLLDLLVEEALADDRQAEALVLLDRLAEVDPYDERHHLRTAAIHLEAGNRGRALDALARAERMLADLRVAPSPAVRQLREQLDLA